MNKRMRTQSDLFNKFQLSPNHRPSLRAIGLGLLLLAGSAHPVFAAGRQFLPGHVPAVVSRLQSLGHLPGTNHLQLAIGLPLRNEQALDDLLRQIYDPASPNFRHYLTPQQFTERFGPTEQDYQAVIDFAKANGLKVTALHDNRLLLDVSGSAANVERAFGVTLQIYRHPAGNRLFYAPNTEPTVAVGLPVADIQGLSDFSRPHPKLLRKNISNAKPETGSAPDGSGSYFGNDFRNAYVPGVSLTGAGQAVGLFQADGYYANDIAAYAAAAGNGRTNIVIQKVLIDGFSGTPTTGANSGNGEVSLDIEMAMAMAPGLSRIVLFEGNPNHFIPNDILNTMAASNTIKNLSSSWGWSGGPTTTTDSIFKQMATQGQTYFNASGDSDAFTPGANSVNGVDNTTIPNAPSSSTNIIQVGGTTLTMAGAGAAYVSETTWNWGAGSGSSGGISSYYSIPNWQTNINMSSNLGSTTQRNIPDVAMTADNIYVVSGGSGTGSGGWAGTSCAAPLWAGFIALANQQALAGGKSVVGFINPALYAIGGSTNYLSDFNDILTGNNFSDDSTNLFPAVAGYDLCTGWGTPAGDNLIDALATVSDALAVAPGRGFAANGPAGGAFTACSQSFTLTNSGVALLNWSLINTSAWLTASSTNGTLTPGGVATNITLSLNPAACGLAAGVYTANVLFTNKTSQAVRTRQFVLLVGQQMIQNSGFEYDTLSYWMQTGPSNSYSFDNIDDTVAVISGISPHSGNCLMTFGMAGTLGFISQSLPTVPNQGYLVSLWFNSPNVSVVSGGQVTAHTPNEFSVSWNGSTLFDQTNIDQIGWTNLQFVVKATGPNTILQFGGRDDPWYLGLDDVTVTPIPKPLLQAPAKMNNNFYFSWNTMSNIVYQAQYKTNLSQATWIPFSTNTGTGSILWVTNAIGSDPWRFYRVIVP